MTSYASNVQALILGNGPDEKKFHNNHDTYAETLITENKKDANVNAHQDHDNCDIGGQKHHFESYIKYRS